MQCQPRRANYYAAHSAASWVFAHWYFSWHFDCTALHCLCCTTMGCTPMQFVIVMALANILSLITTFSIVWRKKEQKRYITWSFQATSNFLPIILCLQVQYLKMKKTFLDMLTICLHRKTIISFVMNGSFGGVRSLDIQCYLQRLGNYLEKPSGYHGEWST